MPAWLWWTPLTLLVVALGIWGFRWGWIAATITETDVINAYAQRYLDEAGADARVTDCTAIPGDQGRIWIIIRCVSPESGGFEYPADRFGRLLDRPRGAILPAAPEI
ncbi:hypothetical protein ROLI_012000 [Roseobacter fucihabitans]|uniref:Uncharacterized protein n=1 Tax=Roseobacter fucihabitans TaxID=1537242 RepID=A0ABZ2BQB5_9RHOB|nr:hypothetical protein [Roseobacter litoralis]MBC6964272.1 hypothetical protein [Roseobacter litoralis]